MKVRETARHVAGTVKMVAVKAKDAVVWTYKKIDWAISPGTYIKHFWVPDKQEGRTLRAYLFAGVALGCLGVVGASVIAAALGTSWVSAPVLMGASAGQYIIFGDDHFREIHAQMPLLFGVLSWVPYVGLIGLSGVALKKHGVELVGSLALNGLTAVDRTSALKVAGHSGLSAFRLKTGSHNLATFVSRMKKRAQEPRDPQAPPAPVA